MEPSTANQLTTPGNQNFFLSPQFPMQRQYEALRAYLLEEEPSADVADVRRLDLSPCSFRTPLAGLFLFLPLLDRIDLQAVVTAARLPSSQMIPAAQAVPEAVQFFHIDALYSRVGMKVDFDMQLTLAATSLYRMMAQRIGRIQPLPGQNCLSQSVGSIRQSGGHGNLGCGDPGQACAQSLSGRLRSGRSAHRDALVRREEADHPICPSRDLTAQHAIPVN